MTEYSTFECPRGTALRDGVATIERLTGDLTRNPPQLHEAAARVSSRVVEQFAESKATIEGRIAWLHASGSADVGEAFVPNLRRSHLDTEIIRYVREQSARPDGVVKIHDLVRSNRNVAAVIYQAEGFLLGLAETTHAKLRFDAIEHHLPNAYKKMVDSVEMRELPAKLDAVMANVRHSFHNPAIAAQMGTRVSVD